MCVGEVMGNILSLSASLPARLMRTRGLLESRGKNKDNGEVGMSCAGCACV